MPSTPTQDKDWRAGKIYRFAGAGTPGFQGDGGPAASARLHGPAGLAIDPHGNVYIADLRNHAIRRVDAQTRVITTVAGTGRPGFSGDGSLAVQAELHSPEGVAVDSDGNLYISDSGNQRIRRKDARTGTITTIAGTGAAGFNGFDGPALERMLNHPSGVAVDSRGRVYFNDYANDLIRVIDHPGHLLTCAGTGIPGYSGDGGPARAACISDVYGIGLDPSGSLYFVDSLNFAIRRVDRETGVITTVIGQGRPGPVIEFAPIAAALLGGTAHPKGSIGSQVAHGVDVDREGNVFIAETGVRRLRVLVAAAQRIVTIAGNGESGLPEEGSLAINAPLEIHGVRVSSAGQVFYLDFLHHVVNEICF